MKRIKFKYVLTDQNKIILKENYLKFGISHFLYAIYKTTYAGMFKKQLFWDRLKKVAEGNTLNPIYNAIYNNNCAMLTNPNRLTLSIMLHTFGYFSFLDIFNIKNAYFIKRKNLQLIDSAINFSNVMTFHHKKQNKVQKLSYCKNTLSCYLDINAKEQGLMFDNNTYHLNILDPINNHPKNLDIIDKDIINNEKETIDYLNENYNGKIEFRYVNNYTNISIYFSTKKIDELEDSDDKYNDNSIFIYVKENLYTSKYNHFIDSNNLVVNLNSASIIQLEDDKFNAFKNCDITKFSDEELFYLKKMCYITNYKNDKEFLNNFRFKAKKGKQKFGLTILTTTGCNARCSYCYEEGINHIAMNKATCDKIVKLIQSKTKDKITLSWFGGEPLTNANAIEYITNRLIELKIDYDSTMITNGYLIDKYIGLFKKWKMKSVQVTLDGINDKYNIIKRYVYKDNNPFIKIINNIKLLIENKIRVAIRLNFNKYNYLDIEECIEYIYQTFGKNKYLNVYINHIYGEPETYHLEDGTNLYLILFKKLLECGYVDSLANLRIQHRDRFCFATNDNHFVINSNGDLYGCEHAVIDKEIGCFGNLDKGIINKANENYWRSLNYPCKECNDCDFLQLCQGGCKYEDIGYHRKTCLPFLDCFDDIIVIYYNYKINKELLSENN